MKELTLEQKVDILESLPELHHIDAMHVAQHYYRNHKGDSNNPDWHTVSDYLCHLSNKGLLSETLRRIDNMVAYKLG